MGSASGTPDSLEGIALTILRDLGPARQRGPCHERATRKRFKAWVSCSDPAPAWVARSRSFAKERPRDERRDHQGRVRRGPSRRGDGNRHAASFLAWAAGPPDELCGPTPARSPSAPRTPPHRNVSLSRRSLAAAPVPSRSAAHSLDRSNPPGVPPARAKG
jgi:hypothetical protein